MDKTILKEILKNQKDEINGYHLYKKIAATQKDPHNRDLLERISRDELAHYQKLKVYSGKEVKPSRFMLFLIPLCARLLGLNFTLKFMERGEAAAPDSYAIILKELPDLKPILIDEEEHEQEILNLLEEERLNYMGSIVLGLNDALVELSGALAGFTFAIQNSRTIALMGLITGISASFSMAASEFLSQKQEEEENAFRSSLYTGLAYILTVILLVLPFFLFTNPFINLALTLTIAVLIILVFNFYIATAKNLPFTRRFLEMAAISIGVALLSFGIGWIVKTYLGFEI